MSDEPTPKQRAYLDFICDYTALHRQPPSERDMGIHFRDAPPEVHRIVVALTTKGLIARVPGQPRSIRVLAGTGEPAVRVATPKPYLPNDIREPLDAEIAPLVLALRAEGVVTLASCAGHGKAPPSSTSPSTGSTGCEPSSTA